MTRVANGKVKRIESAAMDVLLEVYGSKTSIKPPINVTGILKKYGLELKVGDFKDPEIVGAYDKSTKTIFIDGNQPYTRRAFTIAHEFGHYMLHKDKDSEFFYRMDTFNIEKQNGSEEAEANIFAASLLMPEPIVRDYWWGGIRKVYEYAALFKVSNTTAYFRLKNLQLVS
jgi:Zn-dependent peptidase ImmA (M78 family)